MSFFKPRPRLHTHAAGSRDGLLPDDLIELVGAAGGHRPRINNSSSYTVRPHPTSSALPRRQTKSKSTMIDLKNKTLLAFIFFNALFLVCAVLLVAIPAAGHKAIARGPSLGSVAQVLLLDECPLTAAIVNGVFMLLTFALSIPAILLKKNRLLLTIHAYLLIFNAIFTLGVGLAVWFSTLQTKANLVPIWNHQTPFVQSMLQFKFNCCGYSDPTRFVPDSTCTSVAEAVAKGSCTTPFSAFANQFLDVVFTSMFGFCAVDGLLLLSGLCVISNRNEAMRYELIDEKRARSNYSSYTTSRS